MAALPKTQKALVALGRGELGLKDDVLLPELTPDMAIVKTAAVAINPADAKMLDYSAAVGAIVGYDYAGTVVALGSKAAESGRLAVGDRVAGLVHGMNKLIPDVGAFSEYVGACADLLLKIPDTMSFEEGATFGTGVATASLSLFRELGVPASLDQLRAGVPADDESREGREFVLVSGGATATGTRAIQLLRLAGLRPITTCSPGSFDLVYRFGAEKAFDYRSPTCADDIKAYTDGELMFALDCVSQADTTQLCYSAMSRAGGRYVALEPYRGSIAQTRARTVEASWVMVLTIFGRTVALDGEYGREERPADRVFGAKAFAAVQDLLDRGLVQTHPAKISGGGWEGVADGVNHIRKHAMSGQKLVYSVA
ncbi:Zinc-binding dehydrogenase [Geosmithia morbida]|uniref:Zinc-binding dehydrogenase n=1 Tax=Geosmithia morbida TaxID=1094350 RepID=A0A9P5D0D6_9HYPO|nr:Zinc-binding dehydrogenase [Geosmithia morbida]KAF4119341.1 Zinc-binding dehydrogenase [Geosmithia morbida]